MSGISELDALMAEARQGNPEAKARLAAPIKTVEVQTLIILSVADPHGMYH